jgi:CDP-diacylglycerol--glycerol-3-phosphate 3-phosphatidyltransferase
MQLNIPNILTLARIALIPIFVVAFYLPVPWANVAATMVFAVAAVTDWLDGYLARRLKQMSVFGAFLDPVADKLMVAVVLVLLVEQHPTMLFTVPAAVIVGREIAVSALREWMAEIGKRAHVAVSMVGKVKTTVQMAALVLLLYREPVGAVSIELVGMVLLYVAAALTLWSAFVYMRAAWPLLTVPEGRHGDEGGH